MRNIQNYTEAYKIIQKHTKPTTIYKVVQNGIKEI